MVFSPIVALLFSSLLPMNAPYHYYHMPLSKPLFSAYKLVDCRFVLVMVFVRNHTVVARPPILPCVLALRGTSSDISLVEMYSHLISRRSSSQRKRIAENKLSPTAIGTDSFLCVFLREDLRVCMNFLRDEKSIRKNVSMRVFCSTKFISTTGVHPQGASW